MTHLTSVFGSASAFLTLTAHVFAQGEPGPERHDGIHWAACTNDVAAIEKFCLEDRGAARAGDSDHRTPLHYAAAFGSIDAIKVLLQHGAQADAQTSVGVTPLMWAFEFHKFDAFKLLLRSHQNLELWRTDGQDQLLDGRSVGTRKCTVLAQTLASSELPLDCLAALLDAGADPNNAPGPAHQSPLEWAIINKDPEPTVKCLIDHGAKTDLKDIAGNTALDYAVARNLFGTMRLLLDRGANIQSQQDGSGRMSSAQLAVVHDSLACLKLAISFGSPVKGKSQNAVDLKEIAQTELNSDLYQPIGEIDALYASGYTSAHFAALYGYPDAFEKVKKQGLPIDEPDAAGNTPLAIAAKNGLADCCKELLKLGARVNHKNVHGETVLTIARNAGFSAIVTLLATADEPQKP